MRKKDLTGKRFGHLTVIAPAENINGRTAWRCRCDCGKTVVVKTKYLTNGDTTSCGHVHIPDLTGQRFGRLVVVKPTGGKSTNYNREWLCQCDCGGTKIVTTHDLRAGFVKSCGCLYNERQADKGQRLGDYIIENHIKDGTQVKLIASKKLRTDNKSGIRGVSWDKTRHKWVAQLRFQGKNHNLGRYDNIADAKTAREKAEEKYFKPAIEKYKDLIKK